MHAHNEMVRTGAAPQRTDSLPAEGQFEIRNANAAPSSAAAAFLAWEKFRLAYNVIFALVVLCITDWNLFLTPFFWLHLVYFALAANVCFSLGYWIEGWLALAGIDRCTSLSGKVFAMNTTNSPEPSFADTLHDAHAALLRDLKELETAVAPSGQEDPAKQRALLEKVRMHLADHFRFEEEGGYMAPVLKEAPHFSPRIQELFAEHNQMAQTLAAIIQDMGKGPIAAGVSRQKILAWIGKVRHHETRENDLVVEAYYTTGAAGD